MAYQCIRRELPPNRQGHTCADGEAAPIAGRSQRVIALLLVPVICLGRAAECGASDQVDANLNVFPDSEVPTFYGKKSDVRRRA